MARVRSSIIVGLALLFAVGGTFTPPAVGLTASVASSRVHCSGIPWRAIRENGTLRAAAMPLFHTAVYPVVPGGPGRTLVCIPSLVDFPAVDGGRAVRRLRTLAGSANPPTPTFSSTTDALVGYLIGDTYVPLADALASGQLPASFVTDPPSAAMFRF
jgi:hypothetical protein